MILICRDCRIPYHEGLTCDAHRAREIAKRDSADKTAEYIAATTKPCPGCGARTSHFHGHQCHHIRPDGGCTNCRTHWCYACGATEDENRRERGWRSGCRCRSGFWSSFCKSSNIRANLVQLPYPHDRRCGCQICPECRRGSPCDTCDGRCVVCTGAVPPGPPSLMQHDPSRATCAEITRGCDDAGEGEEDRTLVVTSVITAVLMPVAAAREQPQEENPRSRSAPHEQAVQRNPRPLNPPQEQAVQRNPRRPHPLQEQIEERNLHPPSLSQQHPPLRRRGRHLRRLIRRRNQTCPGG